MSQSQALLADPVGMNFRTSVGAPRERLMLFLAKLEPGNCGAEAFRTILPPPEAGLGLVETIPKVGTIPDFAVT